jgi:hypothetical protein
MRRRARRSAQPLGALVVSRAVITTLSLAAAGAVVLSIAAPWVNPCIGASRFSDCVDPFSPSGGPEDLERLCYWGICDLFLSPSDLTVRVVLVLVILLIPTILSARIASGKRAIHAFAALAATIVLGFLVTWFLYPYAFS